MRFPALSATFAVVCTAASITAAAQTVVAVRPSGASVPDNLLRLSIVFSKPPTEPVIPSLQLLRDDGSIVNGPFDPQELWSPDGLILTVLLQPGRVKIGLIAHNTLGRALLPGEHIRLELKGREIATWTVTNSTSTPPSPSHWKIYRPMAGTRATLIVMLPTPIDAMDGDLVAIAGPDGRRVIGKARLSRGERQWSFVPSGLWRRGPYALFINSELEDSAGNRVGQPFEHIENAVTVSPLDTSIPFRIR